MTSGLKLETIAQWVETFPSKHKTLSEMAHAHNISITEVGTGKSQVHSHPWLLSKFEPAWAA